MAGKFPYWKEKLWKLIIEIYFLNPKFSHYEIQLNLLHQFIDEWLESTSQKALYTELNKISDSNYDVRYFFLYKFVERQCVGLC